MVKSALERFEEKCAPCPTSGCTHWIGNLCANGYGQFWINGKVQRAHRISWRFYVGEIPGSDFVLHKCDVRCCVNPDHLFLGDATINAQDMVNKKRGALGEKSPHAKLTKHNVLYIRESSESSRVLAAKFGVSHTNIRLIKNKETWSWF